MNISIQGLTFEGWKQAMKKANPEACYTDGELESLYRQQQIGKQ